MILLCAWVTDTLSAAKVEKTLAADIRAAGQLRVSPRVWVGGTPYLAAWMTGKVPSLSVEMRDVRDPALGLVTLRTEAKRLVVDKKQVFSGDWEGVRAKYLVRSLRLDGVSLGGQLGMDDLQIQDPHDISPLGQPETEAVLTGTPPGLDDKYSVLVKLRITDGTISITPVEIQSGPPAGKAVQQQAMNAFTWSADSPELPIGGRADTILCTGGGIIISSATDNVVLSPVALSPLHGPDADTAGT